MSLLSETTNRTRVYYFLVAALGVFVLVLAIGRDHRGGYSATATVQPVQDAAAFRALTLNEIQRRIVDEDATGQIYQELCDAGFGKVEGMGLGAIEEVLVQPAADHHAGGGVLVTFSSADADAARTTVDRLCELYVDRQSEADHLAMSSGLLQQQQVANQAMRRAEDRLAAAQQALADFDERHRDTLRFPQASLVQDPEPVDAAAQQRRQQQIQDLDRQVQMLSGQLADQERIRRQLRSRMTVQHPKIVDVSQKIDALRDQLATAQFQLEREQELATAPSPSEVKPSKPPREEIEAERAVLLAASQHAEQHLEKCAQKQQGASEQLARCQYEKTWMVIPAAAAQYESPATPLALLVFSGALAMVAGSGMLFAAGGMVQTIDNVADAERLLGIPVIGDIEVTAEPRQGNCQTRARLVRMALLFFEMTLGIFLLGMLLSAMLVDDFALQLRTDPLSALADGLSRLWQIVTGY